MKLLYCFAPDSFDLEIELNRSNIPFIKVGGFKFMETAHIKDVLAHMKVLTNPKDSVSWHRILLLLEKIGPKTANEIFRQVLSSAKDVGGLTTVKPRPGYAKSFERLRDMLEDLVQNPFLPVAEIGERVVDYYRPQVF